MTEVSGKQPFRSLALDALRGLAIIGMVFSGMLPGCLPAWMFHARTPPPTMHFDKTIMGITWVDLVLPFFVFALGAAIPFALKKRMDQSGGLNFGVVLYILGRFLLLSFFAIFLPQIGFDSWKTFGPVTSNLMTMLGFGVMFMFFARFTPDSFAGKYQRWITLSGFGLLCVMLWLVGASGNDPFSFEKKNIILAILANVYVVTSFVWVFTRNNLTARVLVLVFLTALRFSSESAGWVKDGLPVLLNAVKIGDLSVLEILLNPAYIQFAHIAIVGTLAGEMILKWIATVKKSGSDAMVLSWSKSRLALCATLFMTYNVILCVGLFSGMDRELFLVCLFSLIPLAILLRKPVHPFEICLSRMGYLGLFLILTGLVFGPANDGIHKDSPSTIGYLYCTSGLACFTLGGLMVLIDEFRILRGFKLLIANGQNPMIAYVVGGHLLWPVLSVTGIVGLGNLLISLTGACFGGTLWAIMKTLLLMIVVAFFTKKRIFWRT